VANSGLQNAGNFRLQLLGNIVQPPRNGAPHSAAGGDDPRRTIDPEASGIGPRFVVRPTGRT